MKHHWILIKVLIFAFTVLGISGHERLQNLAQSQTPYFHHWANVYSLDNGHGSAYNYHLVTRIRTAGGGNYIIGGSKFQDTAGDSREQMTVFKLTKSGLVSWGISPLGCGHDGRARVSSLAVMSDGRIAVLGEYMETYDSLSSSIVLMMLSRNGSVQRIKSFLLGEGYDFSAYDLQTTNDGGLILTGQLDRPWIAKLNSSGKIVWQHFLDGTVLSIQQTLDGGFIGAGFNGGYIGSPSSNAWLVKFNGQGKIIWQISCGDPAAGDVFRSVVRVGNGFVAVGETQGLGASQNDAWVVRFDNQGHIRWQQALARTEPGHSTAAASVLRLREGGYLICANSDEGGLLVRLDALGNPLWANLLQADLEDAVQTDQGDCLLIGWQILPSGCYPVGDIHNYLSIAARIDSLGNIGQSCCLISSVSLTGRMTSADSYDPQCAISRASVQVGSLSPTDPGYKPLEVFNVCQADVY
jgi:hypothetical protein